MRETNKACLRILRSYDFLACMGCIVSRKLKPAPMIANILGPIVSLLFIRHAESVERISDGPLFVTGNTHIYQAFLAASLCLYTIFLDFEV